MDGQRGRCGPYAAQYAQHSLTGTVQSSTRGLSSLVRHSPFCLISHSYPSYLATSLVLWPSIIIIDILYRGLYFIHVSHRGMRLFGILYASLLPQSLYFPPSSFFPPVIWSAKSLFSFFLCTFFEIWLWCRGRWRSSQMVELDNVCVGIITRFFIELAILTYSVPLS